MVIGLDIKPLVELVLIGEIVTQAKFAELAACQLESTTDLIETWSAIQSILVATANVSKILWPSSRGSTQRGKHLRNLLGVEDDNLLSERTFRNHFEHYDERIEEWFKEKNSAVYMDYRIDSFSPNADVLPQIFHRSYNPSTKTLTFRGNSIDLEAILSELAKVRVKCLNFALP